MRPAPLALLLLAVLALPAAADPSTQPAESTRERLAEARSALEEAGAPTTLDGFADQFEPVADDLNPAIEMQRAAAVMEGIESEAWQRFDFNFNGRAPLFFDEEVGVWGDPPDWPTLIAAADDLRPVFDALDGIDAKLRPNVDVVQADFGLDWRGVEDGMTINIYFPALTDGRGLANRLRMRAFVLTHIGRHDAIEESILRMLGIADATDVAHTMLSGHLTSLGIDAHAADTLIRIAPHLSIGDGETNLSPAQAKRLIGVLLNDRSRRAGLNAAMRGEVIMQQTAIDGMMRNPELIGDEPAGFLARTTLKPWLRSNGTILSELMLPALYVGDAETFPAAQPMLEAFDEVFAEIEDSPTWYRVARILPPSVDNSTKAHFRGMNLRRMAAVSLAVAMYRHEHDEQLPPTLEALVPDYLPAVPTDAMTDGEPIRYDANRQVAWTVGEDGRDDGGFSRHDRLREDPDLDGRALRELGVDDVARLSPATR